MALNRYGDAVALCDRMIESDPQSPSNAYAKFIKGNELLCGYDPDGIRYVMEAVEANSNFAENGLNAIILFCRRMGMQEELELYTWEVITAYIDNCVQVCAEEIEKWKMGKENKQE